MKRLFITLTISFFAVLSFAQPASETDSLNNDSAIVKIEQADKIAKLENDVKELKASNEMLKKQIAELKKQVPVKKKKLVVSRTGSKQPAWVEQ